MTNMIPNRETIKDILGLFDELLDGRPYYTKCSAVQIKAALVDDGVVACDAKVFILDSTVGMYKLISSSTVEPKEEYIEQNPSTYIRDGQTVAEARASAQYFIDRGTDAKGKRITSPDLYMDAAIKKASKR